MDTNDFFEEEKKAESGSFMSWAGGSSRSSGGVAMMPSGNNDKKSTEPEQEAENIKAKLGDIKYKEDKETKYLPQGNITDPNFNNVPSMRGIQRIIELSKKHNLGLDNDEVFNSWNNAINGTDPNSTISNEEVSKNLAANNPKIGNNPYAIGEVRQMLHLYKNLPDEKKQALGQYWAFQKAYPGADPFKNAYVRKQENNVQKQNSNNVPTTQPSSAAGISPTQPLTTWDYEQQTKLKTQQKPTLNAAQLAAKNATAQPDAAGVAKAPVPLVTQNYTKAAYAEWEFLKNNKPFTFNEKNEATISTPSLRAEEMENRLTSMLVNDLTERQQAGYYKQANPKDLFSGKYYNRITGEFIDDGSPTAEYLSNMQVQMAPLLTKMKAMHQLYLMAANDTRNQTKTINNEKIWKRSLNELSTNNAAQSITQSAFATAGHLSTTLKKLITSDKWAEERAKELGYNSAEEGWAADEQNAIQTLGAIAKTITKVGSGAKDEFDNFVKDYHAGYLGLNQNGALPSDIVNKLQESGDEAEGKKVADSRTLFNELLNQSYNLIGDLSPVGGMSASFKIAGGALEAYKIGRAVRAANKIERLAKTMGVKVLERAKVDGLNVGDDVIKAVMETEEGRKLHSILRSVNKVSMPEQIARDAAAFTLHSLANNDNIDKIGQAAVQGAAFGLVNNVFGELFAKGFSASANRYMNLSPFAKKIIEPHFENMRVVGSAMSNVVANPVSSLVAKAMSEGDLSKLIPMDDAERRQVVIDALMGVIFAGNDLLTHGRRVDYKHSNDLYKAFKEYNNAKKDIAESNAATLDDMVAATLDLNQKTTEADEAASHRGKKNVVYTNEQRENKTIELSEEDISEYNEATIAAQEQRTQRQNSNVDQGTMIDNYFNEKASKNGQLVVENKTELSPLEIMDMIENTVGQDNNNLPLLKGMTAFIKNLPEGMKILVSDNVMKQNININGKVVQAETPAAYDAETNTIHINKNYKGHNNYTALANTISQEMMHAITVKPLQNPEKREIIDNLRTQVRDNWLKGKYDDQLIRDYQGRKISVKDAYAVMAYYLGSPEEFIAGIYDANTPLFDIVSNQKLPKQKTNKIINAVGKVIGTPSVMDSVNEFVANKQNLLDDPKRAGETQYNAFPIDLFSSSKDNKILQSVEGDIENQLVGTVLEDTIESASAKDFKMMYGAARYSDVQNEWKRILDKDGAEELVKSVTDVVDKFYTDKGLRGDITKSNERARALNTVKAYIRNHINDESHNILYVKTRRKGDPKTQIIVENEIKHIASNEDRLKAGGVPGDMHPTIVNGANKPLTRYSKPATYGRAAIKRLIDRYDTGNYLPIATKELTGLLQNFKKTTIQYHEIVDDVSQFTSGKFPKFSDNFFKYQMGRSEGAKEFLKFSIQALKDTGTYLLPRIGSVTGIDVRPLLASIKGFGNDALAKYEVSDAVSLMDNAFVWTWLRSYEGGNNAELSKFGKYVDAEKLFALDPARLAELTDRNQLFDAVFRDDVSAREAMQKYGKEKLYKELESKGFTVDVALKLREKLKPIMYDEYTGNNNLFGRKMVTEVGDDAALHKALERTFMWVTDPGGKSFGRTSVVNSDGTRDIKASKMSEKYLSIVHGGSQDYGQIPDMETGRVLLGRKYDSLFDNEGNPIPEQWEQYGFNVDKRDGAWNAYERVLRLDSDVIEKLSDKYPWISDFVKANTDGATIIVNDKTAEVYSDIIGKKDITTFKNASVAGDKDHVMINKTAFHRWPSFGADRAESLPPEMRDNWLQQKQSMDNLFESLRKQGISKIVMTTALKSGGTFALKEGRVSLPGENDIPVLYNHMGMVKGFADKREASADDMNVAMVDLVLSGGTVPDVMWYEQPLFGVDNGMSFITAGGNSKNKDRAFTQQTMPGWNAKDSEFLGHLKHINVLYNNNLQEGINAIKGQVLLDNIKKKLSIPTDGETKALLGKFAQQLHEKLYSLYSSDDPDITALVDDKMLRMISRTYNQEDNMQSINESDFRAFVTMYPELFGKESIASSILKDQYDKYDEMQTFGAGLRLVPMRDPLGAVANFTRFEIKKAIKKHGSVEDAQQEIQSIIQYQTELIAEHFDENGKLKDNSLGVIIGEDSLNDVMRTGRMRYGNLFKDVGLGYKAFGDLKPADNVDSNAPVVIIGTFPGKGVMFPPKRAEWHGRDFDNDDFGILFQSPDWETQEVVNGRNTTTSNNFLDLHDMMVQQGFPYREDLRTVPDPRKNGKSYTIQELNKLNQKFIGKNAVTGLIFGARSRVDNMHPMSMQYYMKAAEADGMGYMVGKTKQASIHANHTPLAIPPIHKSKSAYQAALASKGESPRPMLVNSAKVQIPMVSYLKQVHDVDLFQPNPVSSEDMYMATYVKGFDGTTKAGKDAYDRFRFYMLKDKDNIFRNRNIINDKLAIENEIYENYFLNQNNPQEAGKSKTVSVNITDVLPDINIHSSLQDKEINDFVQSNKNIVEKNAMSVSKNDFDKMNPDFATKMFGLQLMRGFPFTRTSAEYPIVQRPSNVDPKENLYVSVKLQNGEYAFRLQLGMKGSTTVTAKELFNLDGTLRTSGKELLDKYGATVQDLLPDENGKELVYNVTLNNGKQVKQRLGINTDLTPQQNAHLLGNSIAHRVKDIEGDSDIAATHLLLASAEQSGFVNTLINQHLTSILSGMKEYGIEPKTLDQEVRKYAEVSVYDPAKEEFVPLQKFGKKYYKYEEKVPEPSGVKISETVQQRTLGKDELLENTYQLETMDYQDNTPLENSIFKHLSNRYKKEVQQNKPMQFGAFDIGATIDNAINTPSAILERAKEEMGRTDLFGRDITPFDYGVIMSHIRTQVENAYPNIPMDQLDNHFARILPDADVLQQFAIQVGATNSDNAMQDYMMMHLYDSIKALRELDQVYKRQTKLTDNDDKPWWQKTTDAVYKIGLLTNSWQSNHAAAIVEKTATNRLTKTADDKVGKRYVFENGKATEQEDMKYGDRIWGFDRLFKGVQSVPEALHRFVYALDFTDNVKSRGEVSLDRFLENNNNLPIIKSKKYDRNIDAVQYIKEQGYLDDETKLPQINIKAVSKNTSSADSDIVTITINNSSDIDTELRNHYKNLPDAEKEIVIAGIKHLIQAKAIATQHANDVAAIGQQHYNMIEQNQDINTDDIQRIFETAVAAKEKSQEKADMLVNMSLKDIYYEVSDVPETFARNTILSLLSKKRRGTGIDFSELWDVTDTTWQKDCLHRMGQKILPEIWNKDTIKKDKDKMVNFFENVLRRKFSNLNDTSLDLQLIKEDPFFLDLETGLTSEQLTQLQKISVARILDAYNEVIADKLKARPAESQPLSDWTMNNINRLPYLSTETSKFVVRSKNNLHNAFREQSRDALNMYMNGKRIDGTSVRDQNQLADRQTTWLMTNSFGQNLNFQNHYDVDKFVEGINANIDNDGMLTDHPLVAAGENCMVTYLLPNNQQSSVVARYVGSFKPNLYKKKEGSKEAENIGYYSKPQSVFYNEKTGKTYVVPSDRITYLVGNQNSGWGGKIDKKKGESFVNAKGYLGHLQEQSRFVIADVLNPNYEDDGYDRIAEAVRDVTEFGSSQFVDNLSNILKKDKEDVVQMVENMAEIDDMREPFMVEQLISAKIDDANIANFIGGDYGKRSLPLTLAIEEAAYKYINATGAKQLYAGGKELMKMAGHSAVWTAAALHLAPGLLPDNGMSLAATGIGLAAGNFALRLGKNYLSNITTSSRIMPMYVENKVMKSSILGAIGTKSKYMWQNITPSKKDTEQAPTLAEAKTINKLKESTTFANALEDVGIADNLETHIKSYKDALFMLRESQRLNHLLETEYPEFKETVDIQLNKMAYGTWEQKVVAADFLRNNRWHEFLRQFAPDVLNEATERKLVPGKLAGKKNVLDWEGTPEGKLAKAFINTMGGLSHRMLLEMYKRTQSGGAFMKAGVKAVENAMVYASVAPYAVSKIFKKVVADTEAQSASGSLENTRDIIDAMKKEQFVRGLPVVNPEQAESLKTAMSTIATGSSLKNEYTARHTLGRLIKIFSQFNSKMNEKSVNFYSDNDRYKFLLNEINKDEGYKKYLQEGFGIYLGTDLLHDPKKMMVRKAAMPLLLNLAKIGTVAASTYILAKYFDDDDKEAETVSELQSVDSFKNKFKLLFNDDLQRVTSDYDLFANTMMDIGLSLLDASGATDKLMPPSTTFNTVRENKKSGKVSVVSSARPEKMAGAYEQDMWDRSSAIRGVNQGPIISGSLDALYGALAYSYLVFKGKESYIADNMKYSLVSPSQGSKIKKQKENLGVSYEYLSETQPFNIATKIANATIPTLGTGLEMYNYYANNKQKKIKEITEKGKNK